MVEIDQREGRGKPEVNNRIIATQSWHQALSTLDEARDLPKGVRQQIEQFFVNSVAFTGKQIMVKGWGSARMTRAFIDRNSSWTS
jgi:inorganic pyrophosphatase